MAEAIIIGISLLGLAFVVLVVVGLGWAVWIAFCLLYMAFREIRSL